MHHVIWVAGRAECVSDIQVVHWGR